MLSFTKTVSCLVISTAQQIDTKLIHPSERFHQNVLVKFYSMKDFNFLTHELKRLWINSGVRQWRGHWRTFWRLILHLDLASFSFSSRCAFCSGGGVLGVCQSVVDGEKLAGDLR